MKRRIVKNKNNWSCRRIILERWIYQKTGISAILKATGLPKGSFYFYFKSKTEVAETVLQYYSNIIIDFLRAKAEGAITWDVFCESFIRGFKEELGDRPYYGCPLAVIGMEISFQEENLVKKYRTEFGENQGYFRDSSAKR